MSRPVILLKSPPLVADDPYQKLFEAEGYNPIFINVLESSFCNRESLQTVISSNPVRVFRGVVVTSSRSAEAWVKALEGMSEPGNWSDIPFYVVGETTARALEPMADLHPTKFSTHLILGAHTGNAESLARFIWDDSRARRSTGKLLYITGDKFTDAFTRILHEHDVPIAGLMVYQTDAAGNLEDSIVSVARDLDSGKYGKNSDSVWIAFFAPSSSRFALPYLKQHFSFLYTDNSDEALQGSELKPARVAAIGTTTSEFLTTKEHLRVDALPINPSAESLVASIKAYDKNHADAST